MQALAFAEELASFSAPAAVSIGVTVALIWLGIVMPAIRLVRTFQAKRAYPAALKLWIRADERWTSTYYCSRDDVCFVEGENEWRQPEDMGVLLYKSAPATGDVGIGLAHNPL